MADQIEKLKTHWNGISIDISCNTNYSDAFKEIYGQPLAHLEIRSTERQRLPITKTGYRSHFMAASALEEQGGPEKFVLSWLDHGAASKGWIDYFEKSRQLTLF